MYNPQLETFLCVAEAGSFNKAAERLYISPPAVIKQINLLEESLDLQLFVRTHRGLQLTEAGKSLQQDTRYVIQYCKDSVTRARNAMQESTDVIRIGTSPMTPAQVLVELWPQLQQDCPTTKFQLVPFDNTLENAREILANLGQNIDVVAGVFDETMLNLRKCDGLEISREPICCAVSIHHPLARKDKLTVQDLYGEKLMLMHREWSHYVDMLRDDLWKNHPQIQIVDFDFYDVSVFNQCENNSCVLMAVEKWRYVHPLLKILPVEWSYTIPYGLLHSRTPSPAVQRFLRAVGKVAKQRVGGLYIPRENGRSIPRRSRGFFNHGHSPVRRAPSCWRALPSAQHTLSPMLAQIREGMGDSVCVRLSLTAPIGRFSLWRLLQLPCRTGICQQKVFAHGK